MILTRFLMNSFRKHKGLAILALMYYFYSLGKKMLRENRPAVHSQQSSRKQ